MNRKLAESDLLAPVLRLFPQRRFRRFAQVPLGRKKIDLLCEPKVDDSDSIGVELKIQNWRKALWQAAMNFQLCRSSYIAIWYEYMHRVEPHLNLLDQYGVGLICVKPKSARFVRHSADRVVRLARDQKQKLYRQLAKEI